MSGRAAIPRCGCLGWRRRCWVLALGSLVAIGAGCGARRVSLPSGPGEPLPGFKAILEEASAACRGVRSVTAEIGLTGRAGGARVRARLLAGLARPDRLRLEALAPFGRPVFLLVAGVSETTLWLPRDNRVLRGAPVSAILEALAGVRLEAPELLAILTGCLVPEPVPLAGRRYGSGWWAIDVGPTATAYLRPSASPPQIVAGYRDTLTLEYANFVGAFPMRVLVQAGEPTPSDLRLEISQLETNVPLGAEVFALEVPPDAEPLSLEELRRSGPLAEGQGR